MRVGLYGGTFDPIHLGHLILAESCRESVGLDRVVFVVAGAPPHKPGGRTSVGERVEMARLAVAGHPAFEVSEVEARRPGPHYSADTVEQIAAERPDDELFFLIGADSLVDLPTWRQPDRIARISTLVVANRPGVPAPDPEGLAHALGPDARPILRVAIPPIGIASSDLRRRLAAGTGVRYQIPRAVEAYIAANGLYPRA